MKAKKIMASLISASMILGMASLPAFAESKTVSTAADFKDAVENAATGDTITLGADINLGDAFNVYNSAKYTIDLNGKTLTGRLNFKDAGDITIKNGTVSFPDGQPINVYGSNNATPVKLTIADDTTVSGGYGVCVFPYNYNKGKTVGNALININGTISGANGGIFVNGYLHMASETIEANSYPIINLSDTATITSPDQGIAMNGYCVVNVNGADVTGREAIGVKRGVLNVNSGTLNATGEYVDSVTANNNGTEASGAAISVTSTYNNYPGEIEVNLNGGSYTSDNGNAVYVGHTNKGFENGVDVDVTGGDYTSGSGQAAVYVAPKQGTDTAVYDFDITGGAFSTDVKEYLADGIAESVNNDGFVVKAVNFDTAEVGEYKSAVTSGTYTQSKIEEMDSVDFTYTSVTYTVEVKDGDTYSGTVQAGNITDATVVYGLVVTDIPAGTEITISSELQ